MKAATNWDEIFAFYNNTQGNPPLEGFTILAQAIYIQDAIGYSKKE